MKLNSTGVVFITTLVWNVRYVYEFHVGCDTLSHSFLLGAVSPNKSAAATWGRLSRVFTWSHLPLFCAAPNVVTTNVQFSHLPPPLAGWSRCCIACGVYGVFMCENTQRPFHREEVREGEEPSTHKRRTDWLIQRACWCNSRQARVLRLVLTTLLACLRYQWCGRLCMHLLGFW